MSFRRAATADPEKPPLMTELENFITRWRILESGLSNLSDGAVRKQMTRAIREMDVLSSKIEREVQSHEMNPETESVLADFRQINALFQAKKSDIRDAIEKSETHEMMRKAAESRQDPLQQNLLIDEEQEQLDMVQGASREIVSQMKVLNAATHKLNNMIQDQHQIVVNVDKTITEAKDEMIAGNAELSEAEQYQKEGGRCIFYVLGISGTIAILVGVICAWLFWVNK